MFCRPLRDDERLPVRTHRIVTDFDEQNHVDEEERPKKKHHKERDKSKKEREKEKRKEKKEKKVFAHTLN